MARKQIFKFTLLCSLVLGMCTAAKASPERGVSVITCTPGEELYSTFGHSAIRVWSEDEGIDVVFNFGMFDFSTPNFYAKFLKGDLDYFLGIQSTRSFITSYTLESRGVVEQVLDLPEQEIDRIVQRLSYLSLEQNRYYRYKFISRNCTTEIRDLLLPYLQYEGSTAAQLTGKSYRDYLDMYVVDKPWSRAGINLVLGSRIDPEVTNLQSMFLPEQLFEGLTQASPGGKALVGATINLNDVGPQADAPTLFARYYHLLVLLILCTGVLIINNRKVDAAFMIVPGLLSLLLLFLTFYGGHIEFKANYNILWCNPLLLLTAIGLFSRRGALVRVPSIAILVCIAVTVVVWIFGIQGFDLSFPIVLTALALILWRNLRESRSLA